MRNESSGAPQKVAAVTEALVTLHDIEVERLTNSDAAQARLSVSADAAQPIGFSIQAIQIVTAMETEAGSAMIAQHADAYEPSTDYSAELYALRTIGQSELSSADPNAPGAAQ